MTNIIKLYRRIYFEIKLKLRLKLWFIFLLTITGKLKRNLSLKLNIIRIEFINSFKKLRFTRYSKYVKGTSNYFSSINY